MKASITTVGCYAVTIIVSLLCAAAVRGAPRLFFASAAFSSSRPVISRRSALVKRRFLSKRSLPSSSGEAGDDDLERWERMYNQGRSSSTMADESDTDVIPSASQSHEIRVVTFDLDNTLWKTSATIASANDALATFLDDKNIVQPVRVEKVMGELFQNEKEIYAPNGGKSPVLLTRLRKDALQQILAEHNGYSDEHAIDFAAEAFDVWTDARHDAIPTYYATSVVSCLKRIAALQTSSGQPVLIGAVTDGNSDPRNIPELKGFFDFCVNAEYVGVSKPDKRVYLKALNHVLSHPSMNDVFGSFDMEFTEEAAEDMVGPWWVHIGDDFVKDVVASKSLKMRSIWSRELVGQEKTNPDLEKNKSSTKTVEDFVKDVSEMKIIEMAVGADDYLADSLQQEFADAVVDRFDELHDVLLGWQNKAQSAKGQLWDSGVTPDVEALPQALSDEPNQTGSANTETMFCINCGVKLPKVAKFCSSCGAKQPVLQ